MPGLIKWTGSQACQRPCLTVSPNPDSFPHSDLPSRVTPTLCPPGSWAVPSFGRNNLIPHPQMRGLRSESAGKGELCQQGPLPGVQGQEPACLPLCTQSRGTVRASHQLLVRTPGSGSGASKAGACSKVRCLGVWPWLWWGNMAQKLNLNHLKAQSQITIIAFNFSNVSAASSLQSLFLMTPPVPHIGNLTFP